MTLQAKLILLCVDFVLEEIGDGKDMGDVDFYQMKLKKIDDVCRVILDLKAGFDSKYQLILFLGLYYPGLILPSLVKRYFDNEHVFDQCFQVIDELAKEFSII